MQNLSAKAMGVWVWVILWMAVIFVLSSIPDLRSGFQPLWDLILRKIAHAGEYAVLGWLMLKALRTSGVGRAPAIALAVFLSTLYAATDEVHQTFVPGRNGAAIDVVIDSLGVIVGVAARVRFLP